MTDTNQASEDELTASERFDYERLKKQELSGIGLYSEFRQSEPSSPKRLAAWINQLSPWNLQRGADSIQDLIRTEKLKLLAEVRERAIPNPTTPAGDNEFVPLDELTQLEAEL